MNRLNLALMGLIVYLLSGTSYAMCSSNICSAELPNDGDLFRAVGRISVLLKDSPSWSTAYSKDIDDPNPFDGSCECKAAQAVELDATLEGELGDLRLTYDFYAVQCYMVPDSGGPREWVTQGRFSVGDTSKSYNEWGRFFCGSNSFLFQAETDLVDYRFEKAAAFINDEDMDGLGAGDDHCDNSLRAGPNFGWDAHRSGLLLLGEDAGAQRGCFAPKEWPDAGIKGLSLQKKCTVTASGRAGKATTRSEIFKMSIVAPALVLLAGEDMKAAAQTILSLQYSSQGDVYARCTNGDIQGPFTSKPYGRAYADWQAEGACGGKMETASLEFIPLVSDGEVSVSCTVENDADGDGVGNEIDMCPMSPNGSAVFPDSYSDESLRGCPISCGEGKEFVGERCELKCPASSQRNGTSASCKCDDQTVFDPAAGNICEDKDEDKDGVLWPIDQCPHSAFPSIVDAQGCELDSDRDSVVDRLDRCPLTPKSSTVSQQGCGLDSDNDGIEDSLEYFDAKIDCRNTVVRKPDGSRNEALYSQVIRSTEAYNGKYLGCLRSEVDQDGDGVANAIDLCPNTPAFEATSLSCGAGSKVCGCSFSDLDQDGDGVRNAEDLCPASAGSVANKGCASEDMNAAPVSNVCPVQSFAQLTQDFYRQIVTLGQAADCKSPMDVIDGTGRSYGSVCKGTEGYYTLMLELNIGSVVTKYADLNARAECYVRAHPGATIRTVYLSPLYQDHLVKIWKNRELLQNLSGSTVYACKPLLNDYNVHVSAYHGMNRMPKETLAGHDLGESVAIFDAGPLDTSAEAACALYRPDADRDATNFMKLYP